MICPKCHGRGVIPTNKSEGGLVIAWECDYPGCVQGIFHCCEGDIAQPEQEQNDANNTIIYRPAETGKN